MSNLKIVPTAEELKILRDKLNNIHELNLFKNVYSQKPNSINTNVNSSINNNPTNSSRSNNVLKNTTRDNISCEPMFDDITNNNKQINDNSNQNEIINRMGIRIHEMQEFIEKNKHKVDNYDNLYRENINLRERNSKLEEQIFSLRSEVNSPQKVEHKSNTSFSNTTNPLGADNQPKLKSLINENLKLKSEIALLEQKDKEKEEYMFKLEKEKKMLTEMNTVALNNSGTTSSTLKSIFLSILSRNEFTNKEANFKAIRELFGQNFDYIKFLQMRIDSLELQNYYLITKNEKNINLIKTYLDELIEVYEVVSDIRNVLNQVFDMQSLTKEFMLIRETLNTKNDFLMKKKEIFSEEKKNLDIKAIKVNNDIIKEINEEVLICKDKIFEFKELINTEYYKKHSQKILEILEEKIENYENLKLNLIQYEDIIQREFDKNEDDEVDQNRIKNIKMRESLLNENFILKSKNLQLRNIIENVLINPTYVSVKDESILKEINTHISTVQQSSFLYEDMYQILRLQAVVIDQIKK